MWYEEAVFYQFYPLGLCGAPWENDGVTVPRIRRVAQWVPHLQEMHVDAVYFSPVFESDTHGYDTRDYAKIDCRLGTNADFAAVCDALHAAGIRVVVDGVFNHVGRGFWAFRDVQEKKWDSAYKDWFHLNFDGNSNYNDGFWYEGWEGHYELVKLNLANPAVREYLFGCVRGWVKEFGIDGLRLDVAYCLPEDFLRELHGVCLAEKADFFLLGEMLHGDYNRLVNGEMLHSCTNYECYKGLYSAFNSLNMFEIAHSIARQFGPEQWTLYKGKHLLNFVDNHDVSRIASQLENKALLPALYALLFAMPGIPCLYYGSEWGVEGKKSGGDHALRPAIEAPEMNELSRFIAKLAETHHAEKALCYGSYQMLQLTNKQYVFERSCDGERIIVALNIDDAPCTLHFNANAGRATDLLTGEAHDFGGGSELAAHSAAYWKV